MKTKERDGFTALQLGAVNHSNSKRVFIISYISYTPEPGAVP